MTKFANGYRLDYRVRLEGKVSSSRKAEFQAHGFSIGFSSAGETFVSKYISGTFFFTKRIKNECDRWGNCKFSIEPIKLLIGE